MARWLSLADPARYPCLSLVARCTIEDDTSTILVSAASAWEITTKFRLGRLPRAGAVALDVNGCLASQGFSALSITVDDMERAGAPSIA